MSGAKAAGAYTPRRDDRPPQGFDLVLVLPLRAVRPRMGEHRKRSPARLRSLQVHQLEPPHARRPTAEAETPRGVSAGKRRRR